MKITDVEVVVLKAPGEYGVAPDGRVHGFEYACLILVHTDEGITGISQTETQPRVAEAAIYAAEEASGLFSGLRALAVGQDPLQVEALWSRLFVESFSYGRRGAVLQAISGIDIACWDILGKVTGLPVATLLGGKRRDSAPAYASTLFADNARDIHDAAKAFAEQGFNAAKFGWGPFGKDLRQDAEFVAAAREGLGESRHLMVDAGWRKRRTAKEAIRLVKAIEEFNPYWVEEPCFPEDYATYRRLSESVDTFIAAGEAEATTWGFRQLAQAGGVDILQPDVSRCGGLTIARKIAFMADELNVALCPHAWASDILSAATLQLVAFLPNETFLEFNASTDPVSRRLVTEPLQVKNGYVQLPDKPGLGVDLDMNVIDDLRVS